MKIVLTISSSIRSYESEWIKHNRTGEDDDDIDTIPDIAGEQEGCGGLAVSPVVTEDHLLRGPA